jgi:predicted amidohydrolase
MDATTAPKEARLQRAAHLVEQAVHAGAQLIVLPELFNIGYSYTIDNFRKAESITGETVEWMKQAAEKHQIHLAGSLLLREHGEIFDTLLLTAPDGSLWRYDKTYPWGWERSCFREGKEITVAETAFGKVGMMICWDAAHLDLWRQYAGRIDLMIISSCPPDVASPTFVFPSGENVTLDDFGKIGRSFKNTGQLLFSQMLHQQTAWLGVPSVQSTGTGHLHTAIPNGALFLLMYLPMAPALAKYLTQAKAAVLECDFISGCKIVSGDGKTLAMEAQNRGDGFVTAEVALRKNRSFPNAPQPKSLLPKTAYFTYN